MKNSPSCKKELEINNFKNPKHIKANKKFLLFLSGDFIHAIIIINIVAINITEPKKTPKAVHISNA